MGHEAVICRNKNKLHGEVARDIDQEEEYLFAATCFSSLESSQNQLIDSGGNNHMTNNKDPFKELSISCTLKV